MHDPVDALIRDFGTYLSYFEMEVAPNWPPPRLHRQTIDLRHSLGDSCAVIKDPNFMARLRGALANEFGVRTALNNPLIIDAKFHADIEGLAMCELKSARATDFDRLWRLVDSLKINSNKARLVPNTKMLAHVLTELVVPVPYIHSGLPV